MNYKNKIIILEGPDGAGKTFLGEQLKKMYDVPMVHLTYYKDKEKHVKQFTAVDTLIKEGQNIIVDRYIISDKVYSNVYRDGNVIECFETLYNNIKNNSKVVLIFVLPEDKENYLNEFKRLCAEREEMYSDSMDKVYDEYLKLYEKLKTEDNMFTVVRYDRFK